MKRIAWFDATWDVLLDALKVRDHLVTTNLPADARVHHLVLDHERQMVRVFFTSAELDEIPEGALIPEFVVAATRHEVAVA